MITAADCRDPHVGFIPSLMSPSSSAALTEITLALKWFAQH